MFDPSSIGGWISTLIVCAGADQRSRGSVGPRSIRLLSYIPFLYSFDPYVRNPVFATQKPMDPPLQHCRNKPDRLTRAVFPDAEGPLGTPEAGCAAFVGLLAADGRGIQAGFWIGGIEQVIGPLWRQNRRSIVGFLSRFAIDRTRQVDRADGMRWDSTVGYLAISLARSSEFQAVCFPVFVRLRNQHESTGVRMDPRVITFLVPNASSNFFLSSCSTQFGIKESRAVRGP